MKRLQEFIQWCDWKHENNTKVPYDPRSGRRASSINPQTWVSHEEALAARPHYDGLGFFLQKKNRIVFIDLDDPYKKKDDGSFVHADPDAVAARHKEILARTAHTYAEVSPSGTGVHIAGLAQLPGKGRRRDGVEIYDNDRFMTVTFNPLPGRDLPLADIQDFVNEMYEEMSPVSDYGDIPEPATVQTELDQEIYKHAATALNGAKFVNLYEGRWQEYYSSQSEADFALIDILNYYTKFEPQIVRMFKASALGQRKKADRAKYTDDMVTKSRDRDLPPIDLTALYARLDDVIAGRTPPPVAPPSPSKDGAGDGLGGSSPAHWHNPPGGVIGLMTDYILRSSPYPSYPIALTAALGLFAGIVGRQYNYSGSGLNLYLMLIASTGQGKEAIANGVSRILATLPDTPLRNKEIRGPAEIASGQGLLKALNARKTTPCMVSITGEFGIRLQQLTDPRASSADRALLRFLLELFSRSGAGTTIEPMVYSDQKNNTEVIHSPAFSLVGESTPETFFKAVDEDAISSGLLPRFLIIELTDNYPDFNDDHDTVAVPVQLTAIIQQIIEHTEINAGKEGIIQTVGHYPEADKALKQFRVYARSKMAHSKGEAIKQIWNRAHLKALRTAALLAVSHDYLTPIITPDMAQWAISLVTQDVENMLARFEAGTIGHRNEANERETYIKNEIVRYLSGELNDKKTVDIDLQRNKIIDRSWLQRRLIRAKPFRGEREPTKVFNSEINNLMENGILRRLSTNELKPFTSRIGFLFTVVDPDWLL